MPRMRSTKQQLKQYLQSPQWRDHLEEIAAGGASHVGPLFSFLLLGPQTMHRAAVALGLTTARLAEREPEAARNIIRRFMWHMNEESGNIGWGIPEAFGESLAASPLLAKDFHRVLVSISSTWAGTTITATTACCDARVTGPSAVWPRPGPNSARARGPGCAKAWRTTT